MKRLGLIFSLLLLFVNSVSAKITVTEAQRIVKDYIEKKAGWDYKSVHVYQAPDFVKNVEISFNQSFTLDETSWCFMIDPTPEMKWSHPCKYVCISPSTGTTTVKAKSMFPKDFNKWNFINKQINNTKSFNTTTRLIEPNLFKNKRTNVVKNNGYAVLISGGQYIGGNWQDGWNETSIMYQALRDLHGYKKENITVLMSDGRDPAPDMTINDVEVSSPLDFDGDQNPDVNYASNQTNVKAVFEDLANKSTSNDDIFVYIVSHGGPDLVALYGWNEYLTSQELAVYLDKLKAKSITVFISACHSGSFIDEISGANRTIVTSTSKDESGYVYSNKCDIGTFWEPFFFGLTGTDLKTDADFSCDQNGDKKNDYEESFVYGIANDRYANISRIGGSHSTPHFWTSKPISRTVDISAGSGRIMSDDILTASNKISNALIAYQSSKKVVLKKGFKYTKSGKASFRGIAGGNSLRSLNLPVDFEEDEIFEYEALSDLDNIISEDKGIEIYPNPTDGLLYIKSESEIISVTVTDITGKVIMNENGSSNEMTVDLSSNAKGFYLLNVVTKDNSYTKKIGLK